MNVETHFVQQNNEKKTKPMPTLSGYGPFLDQCAMGWDGMGCNAMGCGVLIYPCRRSDEFLPDKCEA